MVSEKEFNDVDLSVKQNNLYLEESFWTWPPSGA